MVNSTERGPAAAPQQRESVPLVVNQPTKLGSLLESINRITESSASGPAQDWSGSGGAAGQAGKAGSARGPSPRDQAIANIPAPVVIQKQLAQHIQKEVKTLRRQARHITHISGPGAAYHLTLIYSRIRRLNALLSELAEASLEVLKRLFIRVFIDKQSIL